MSGVTLSDLSKYHQGAMKWFKNGLVSEQNRLFAQTEDAGTVSFWPLGGTPLEGEVKFSFKETPPASGDKGPENPSIIAGVSEINIRQFGKNCCVPRYGKNFNQLQFEANQDGTVRIYGTVLASRTEDYITMYSRNWHPVENHFKRGMQYTASFKSTDSKLRLQLYSHNSTGYIRLGAIAPNNTLTFTVPEDMDDMGWFRIQGSRYNNADTVYDGLCEVQIELGTQATDIELPSTVESHSISLGSTYYGGEIDLATGVMTVTHVGFQPSRTYLQSSTVVATGTQNIWQIYLGKISSLPANTFNYNDAAGYGGADYRCNYFQWDRTGNTKSFHTSGGFVYASFEGATAEEARQNCLNLYDTAVANNNPLTVVYPLATPYTVQLTPLQLTALAQKDKYTPRVNTVYTDADSIQIRYRKSLIHDEDEKVQAIAALGGNV